MKKFILLLFILAISVPFISAFESSILVVKDDSTHTVYAKQYERTRLVFANSPRGETLHLSIPGVMLRVEGDLQIHDSVTILPGETRILEAAFASPGTFEVRHDGVKTISRIVVHEAESPVLTVISSFL